MRAFTRRGRARRIWILCSALLGYVCLLTPVVTRAQNPSNGPLTFEEGSPLQRLGYTPMMEAAAPIPQGSISTDLWLGFSNVFEQDQESTHVLFFDMERLISALTVRWGATDRLEVGGRVVWESTGVGALDGVILRYHDFFGFGQANRDRFPEGEYTQRLRDGSGTVYVDIPRQRFGLEGVRLFAKWAAAGSSDGSHDLALRLAARVPSGSNLIADEKTDIALQALTRVSRGRWHVHGLLGAATVRRPPELMPILRRGTVYATVGVERSFGNVSAVFQTQVQSPLLRSFSHREVDGIPANIVFGLSGRISSQWSWDASFQEDLPADTPAVDFTVGLRISRIW